MEKIMRLSQVLNESENLPWDEALFLPVKDNWSPDSLAIVWSLDDLDDDQEIPEIAQLNDMKYVFGVSTVQDIVRNARMQKPESDINDLMKAFMYYYKNDAFVHMLE